MTRRVTSGVKVILSFYSRIRVVAWTIEFLTLRGKRSTRIDRGLNFFTCACASEVWKYVEKDMEGSRTAHVGLWL